MGKRVTGPGRALELARSRGWLVECDGAWYITPKGRAVVERNAQRARLATQVADRARLKRLVHTMQSARRRREAP